MSNLLFYVCSSLSGELSRLQSADNLQSVSVSIRFNGNNPYVLIETDKNYVHICFDVFGFYAVVYNADYQPEYKPIRFRTISFSPDGLLIQV